MEYKKRFKRFLKKTFLCIYLLIVITYCLLPEIKLFMFSDFSFEQKVRLANLKVHAGHAGLETSQLDQIYEFEEGVCYTKECLKAAMRIVGSVNFKEDPCNPEKWLDFVCTRRTSRDFGNAAQIDQVVIHAILNSQVLLTEETTDPHEFLLEEAKGYYAQCSSRGSHHDQKQSVLDILEYTRERGGWPIIGNEMPRRNYSWTDHVAEQNRLGSDDFTPLFFKVKLANNRRQPGLIELSFGRLAFSEKEQNAGMEIIKRLATKLTINDILAAQIQLMAAFEFLDSINQTLFSAAGLINDLSVELTLHELQNLKNRHFHRKGILASINWRGFLERVFSGSTITPREIAVVAVPLYPVLNLLEYIELEMSSAEGRSRVANVLFYNEVAMLLHETSSLTDDLEGFSTSDTKVCVEIPELWRWK